MTRRIAASFLALAIALFVPAPGAFAATPAPAPKGPAVDATMAYVKAVGAGDYSKAFGMLTHFAQRYFGNAKNFASVWQTDRFALTSARAVKSASQNGVQFVIVLLSVSLFDQRTQTQRKTILTIPYVAVKEGGAYRIDDEQHAYRALAPEGITVAHDGGRVTVRKIAFFPRRIEVFVSYENISDGFMTFLPYGRSVFRDAGTIYQPIQTRDWYLTDQQLFLGLRLAASGRYTAPINFQTDHRLDDQARTFNLTIAPALREGADAPIEFALPAIAVPAP